jgi:hypothetical protein
MYPASTIRLGIALLAVAGPFTLRASAQSKVYYISGSWDIARADLDGANQETLVTGLQRPQCLAIDPDAGKIYWGDFVTDKLQRSNLDGAEVEDIGTALNPNAIALDTVRGKVYWTDNGVLYRADLDGANPEVVVDSSNVFGIAVDTVNAELYWTCPDGLQIKRSDLDGSTVVTLVSAASSFEAPFVIELDVHAGKMYWRSDSLFTEPEPRLWRADLYGGNVELLHEMYGGMWYVRDIALDLSAGKLYWAELHSAYAPKYRRSNLDGSQMEDLIPLEAQALDLLVVPDIPAVSTRGLVVMTVLVVAAGTVVLRRRRAVAAA